MSLDPLLRNGLGAEHLDRRCRQWRSCTFHRSAGRWLPRWDYDFILVHYGLDSPITTGKALTIKGQFGAAARSEPNELAIRVAGLPTGKVFRATQLAIARVLLPARAGHDRRPSLPRQMVAGRRSSAISDDPLPAP